MYTSCTSFCSSTKILITLHVSYIGYAEDEPDFPWQNNLELQKTGVWRRQDSELKGLSV